MQAPTIVAGCPRSGTSLTMGALQICGAFVGPYACNPDNPKGTFENLEVLSLMHRRWARDRAHPYDEVRDRLKKQGCAGGPWAFKLAGRMLDYFGCAHEMWPGARWIIVRRDVDSIIASHRARGSVRRHHIDRAHMALKQIGACHDIGSMEIWPQRAVGGDVDGLKEAVAFAGLAWDEKILEFLEPGLWHW